MQTAGYYQTIDISKPTVMSGLLLGAMLPFVFSAAFNESCRKSCNEYD